MNKELNSNEEVILLLTLIAVLMLMAAPAVLFSLCSWRCVVDVVLLTLCC